MLPVAILAGGLAQRMRPATLTIPKSLLPVAGEPFISHQLRLLRREGVERVVLCVGYLGDMIRDHVGDGNRFGLDVGYSFDGEPLLGTGGALRRALPLLGSPFLVLYGDSYLDVPFAPVVMAFERSGAPALMTVMRNNGQWDTSNASFDGHWVDYDKGNPRPDMSYIDYGLAVLTAQVLLEEPEGAAFDLARVYERLSAARQLAGFEIFKRFYEIGTEAGRAETDRYLSQAARKA